MEFFRIKINECEVNVVFNGSTYYFHNSFYGYVAIAERDYEYTYNSDHATKFNIYVGNEHCIGGSFSNSRIIAAVKRLINKQENKYCANKVDYIITENPLNLASVKIEYTLKTR